MDLLKARNQCHLCELNVVNMFPDVTISVLLMKMSLQMKTAA